MDTIYIIFFGIIGIILAIGVGLQLSNEIDEFVIYVLFWMLYIITIITFINIILVINYYISMKNKAGPPGKDGLVGDQGDKGPTGLCDPTCRDAICENEINKMIIDELKTKNIGVSVRMNNTYIKSKVHQMCKSDEFKQLAPYNGTQNLINYLKTIWKIWVDSMYDAGGSKYFENIGAETDFDWIAENPFNDIKKYDVFYWGMGKQYRPQISNKCQASSDGNTIDLNALDLNKPPFLASRTTLYDKIGDDSSSRADNDVSFWRARPFTWNFKVYYPVGDVALGPGRNNEGNKNCMMGTISYPIPQPGPPRETILVAGDVVGPLYYEPMWNNGGYTRRGGWSNPFWLWRPIAPTGYVSLGDVVTYVPYPPPAGDSSPIRCVPVSVTIKLPSNGTVIWNSYGSYNPINALITGYVQNYGQFVPANESNAYNLFRVVIGWNPYILPSDINGSFYQLDTTKYYSHLHIGNDDIIESPSIKLADNKVGQGYISKSPKDVKYSVLSYLKLKNNASLTHSISQIQLQAQLIPNAITNAYLINVINDEGNIKKCLNYDGKEVILGECDELINTQLFSIIFTGNKANECKLQHYNTSQILMYKDEKFTLVSQSETNNTGYELFIMS